VAVQKDVTESVPDLARGAQDVEMVAIGDHRAPARKDPVHGPSDPGRDGFHAAAERIVVASFDDQVNVVALDGVVSEPRHMTGGAACDSLARAVGNAPHRAGLPASAAPVSAPS